MISKYCSVSEYALLFETKRVLVCDCYENCTLWVDLFPPDPPTILNYFAQHYVYFNIVFRLETEKPS